MERTLQTFKYNTSPSFRFFALMGSIFSFVSSDLVDKVNILNSFLEDEATSYQFATCKSMMEYEKSNNLLEKQNYVSGSRTLLRLHRGLDFIRKFLLKLSELNENDNTAKACKQVYNETLANYHTFWIRQGAYIAMVTMPNRRDLLSRVCPQEEQLAQTLQLLPDALEVMSKVYDRMENLYTMHDLHSLP